jgi:tetratricopeptide (TPR) repeat protein
MTESNQDPSIEDKLKELSKQTSSRPPEVQEKYKTESPEFLNEGKNDLESKASKEEKIVKKMPMPQKARLNILIAGAVLGAGIIFLANYIKDSDQKPHPQEVSIARQRLKKGNADLHFDLALALQYEGNIEEAEKEYRSTIKYDPRHLEAHNNLGTILRNKGNLEEAIAMYEIALKMDPNNASIHNNLGLALKGKGNLDQAIKRYRKAIELDYKNARAYNNLGVALGDKGRLEESIEEFRKSIKYHKNNTVALGNLGTALCEKKRFEEAIELFNEIIEIDPNDAIVYYNLGNALYEAGNLKDAIKNFRKSVSLDADLPEPKRKIKEIEASGVLKDEGAIYKFHSLCRNCDPYLSGQNADRILAYHSELNRIKYAVDKNKYYSGEFRAQVDKKEKQVHSVLKVVAKKEFDHYVAELNRLGKEMARTDISQEYMRKLERESEAKKNQAKRYEKTLFSDKYLK